ncbi:CbbQ/NirQ/NorQ/GpvN family protein [Variovorax sp. RHLX14]|uniref:CbbQ/NirQ/NorQ/GpvN family protein n=1 Tax=Variovorax sp. RHLX14 TaxID=1259731 RepID=UPI003F465D46
MPDVLSNWRIATEPYYRPVGDECERFEAAWSERLPMLLKGPTGCGKTRFVEHMAWRLGKPLVTVACNEDTTAGDLVGRWLLDAEGTRWQDGPLTLAARHGAICYLDEIVEARADTAVVIHPLTDTRRMLPIERNGEVVRAHADFALVVSYNPGGSRNLKASTKQRFCGLEFDYPGAEEETEILMREAGVDVGLASSLVALGIRSRRLAGHGLEEGASTRMLVRAAQLVRCGMTPAAASRMALVAPLTDDAVLRDALLAAVDASF